MDEDPRNREGVGHQACMLPRGAAKAAQRIARDVVPALDGDLLDGVRHVVHRDANEAFGDLFRRARVARALAYLGGERGELLADSSGIERLVAARAEDAGKE